MYRNESLYLERCIVGSKTSKAANAKMGSEFNDLMRGKYKSVRDLDNTSMAWHKKKKELMKDFVKLRKEQDFFWDELIKRAGREQK